MTKRLLPAILVILVMAGSAVYGTWRMRQAKNPDPNHTHADFAIWVGGTKLDFSDQRYMSAAVVTSFAPSLIVPSAYAHSEDGEEDTVPGREYLHLHDGNGHVVHRHKPGLTFHDFLESIGLVADGECLTLDNFLFDQVDEGFRSDFALTKKLCSNGKFHWSMYVNGKRIEPATFDYVFQDEDKILYTYDAGDDHALQIKEMTDDACLYSKTCPWRGEPPAENCIADPMVPCVAP